MSERIATNETTARIARATVQRTKRLCREHYRTTFHLDSFPIAHPGQFVQITPPLDEDAAGAGRSAPDVAGRVDRDASPVQATAVPFLPRAFSIAGLRREARHVAIDVIYRAVGIGTQWLASLSRGHVVTVLGPLGHGFPIVDDKPNAWLIAGGVGLPPVLWLAESLERHGKHAVAFCGAQSADLVPLDIVADMTPPKDGAAIACAAEFAACDTPVVISTDDGTCGYCGTVVDALRAHHRVNPAPADTIVAYACGPERMMQAVAQYCLEQGIECYVCMERPMACGVGTCQSCIVSVRSDESPAGRRYALCCCEGPVFDARQVVWNDR